MDLRAKRKHEKEICRERRRTYLRLYGDGGPDKGKYAGAFKKGDAGKYGSRNKWPSIKECEASRTSEWYERQRKIEARRARRAAEKVR